jgi:pyruvate dehydrogenase E2 component (dihydrolipoyllysine-residue acetyltransferase)
MNRSKTMSIQVVIQPWTETDVEEAYISNWFVRSGDAVRAGQALGELMVEKATVEIGAPQDGVVQRVYIKRGDMVKPGTVVAEIDQAGEMAAAQPGASVSTGNNRGMTEAASNTAAAVPGASAEFTPASPAARRLAREQGVDLARITPADGRRITEEDVRRYLATGAPAVASVATSAPGEPLSGRRKVIAERMLRSIQQSAQLTLTTEVGADALVAARAECQARMDVSYTDLLAWIVARALKQHPALNATLEGDRLRRHEAMHLGVAVAVEDGLLVPVLRDADQLTLAQIAAQSRALIERARGGTAAPGELSGSTFSLTNLGAYEIDAFTPILNPPEVGILGIGRIREAIVPRDGQPALGHVMVLSLTFDHRAVDGAPAAAFLQTVKRLVESSASYEGAC